MNRNERCCEGKRIKIDEDKEWTPYHAKNESEIYTDHCAIMSGIEWTGTEGDYNREKTRKVISRRVKDLWKKIKQEKV